MLGYFANHNRFVGGGSGWVNAYKPKTFLEVLNSNNIQYDFLECYDEDKLLIDINTLKDKVFKYLEGLK